MTKIPSPCLGVCKYKREGHCIACSMTKPQKSAFKSMKKNAHRKAFVTLLRSQMELMGKYRAWPIAYEKRCKKRGISVPF